MHKSGGKRTRFQYGFFIFKARLVQPCSVATGHSRTARTVTRGAILHGKAIIKEKKCESLQKCSYYNYYLATLYNFYQFSSYY